MQKKQFFQETTEVVIQFLRPFQTYLKKYVIFYSFSSGKEKKVIAYI